MVLQGDVPLAVGGELLFADQIGTSDEADGVFQVQGSVFNHRALARFPFPVIDAPAVERLAIEQGNPITFAVAAGDGKLFFSLADSETLSRKRHIAQLFGATIAVDPENGDLIWRNTDFRLVRGSRASYRNGTFVVFSPDGAHALDPRTGKTQ